jgi:outer membrane protein
MKFFRSLLVVAALLAVVSSASAQSKIASVDMKKLFNGYYKTKMAQTAMDKEKADLRKELKDMAEALKKASDDYKLLLSQANDQAITSDERDKRKASAMEKAKDVNSRQTAFEQYQRQAETQLNDKSQRIVGNLISEIQKVIADKAKASGYTLVVNSAATDALLYTSAESDITAAVISQLNVGAPIDFNKPATGLLNISTNAP